MTQNLEHSEIEQDHKWHQKTRTETEKLVLSYKDHPKWIQKIHWNIVNTNMSDDLNKTGVM